MMTAYDIVDAPLPDCSGKSGRNAVLDAHLSRIPPQIVSGIRRFGGDLAATKALERIAEAGLALA